MRLLFWCRVALVACGLTHMARASVPPPVPLPAAAQFAVSGLSGMTAWLAIHPGDVIKVRMQLESGMGKGVGGRTSALATAKQLYKEGALYDGLSAALLRQATYTTLRLGLYDLLRNFCLSLMPSDSSPGALFGVRIFVGVISGAIASFLSCPVEVALVRAQADGRLPMSMRRNYNGVFDALFRIAREEGLGAYWRGGATTVIRAMVVSVSQITAYDQAKAILAGHMTGVALHAASASIAAFTFCTVSMPLDTVKSRAQNSQSKSTTNTWSAIATIAREEGIPSLWNGYGPYLVSKGILTVLLFLIKEQYELLAGRLCGFQ